MIGKAPRPGLDLPTLRELFALLQRLNREELKDRFPGWKLGHGHGHGAG
jgi:hypothetical protein